MRGRNISTNFFLYSLLSPSISSSFSTLSSSLLCHSYCTVPHHVSRFIYTAASSPVFFSFVSRLSVLFNPFFANPLFRRSSFGSQTVHTRELSSTRNGISVGSPFLSLSLPLSSLLSLLALASLLEAPLLIANMPITVIYKRRAPAFSFVHPGFSRSRFPPESTNRSIHRFVPVSLSLSTLSTFASFCRIFCPSSPPPLQRDAQGVFRKGRIEERSLL